METANKLATLIAQANESHASVMATFRKAIYYAKDAGDALRAAKQYVGHGNWLTWLDDNFKASAETARIYMRISEHWESMILPALQKNKNFTIEDARKILRRPPYMIETGVTPSTKCQSDLLKHELCRCFRKWLNDLPEEGIFCLDNIWDKLQRNNTHWLMEEMNKRLLVVPPENDDIGRELPISIPVKNTRSTPATLSFNFDPKNLSKEQKELIMNKGQKETHCYNRWREKNKKFVSCRAITPALTRPASEPNAKMEKRKDINPTQKVGGNLKGYQADKPFEKVREEIVKQKRGQRPANRHDRRFAACRPSTYIQPIEAIQPGTNFVLWCRVSTRTQNSNGNNDNQEAELRRAVEACGGTVVGVRKYVGVARKAERELYAAANETSQCGAVLLAESTSRFARHIDYDPKHRPHLVAGTSALYNLCCVCGNVTLVTLHDPDATWQEERAYQAKRGQWQKGKTGGRPHKPAYKKMQRKKLLSTVMKLHGEGMSNRKIARVLKIGETTIRRWVRHF